MKPVSLLLCLLLMLSCLAGCAASPAQNAPDPTGTTDPTGTPVSEPDTGLSSEAEILPDFTVQTIDGGTFTLSEALKTHELVVINLWATWCPPCRSEFPYLQEAWEQASDRVAVIALSTEPSDSIEVLQSFAAENSLSFPIGREEGTDLSRFVTIGIPTTILVDRSGKVAAVEVGAKSSTQAFLDLFDGFTGADYDPNVCSYTVICYGSTSYEGLPGVTINFCTDTTCTPITTDEDGAAVFTGPPAKYHVQIVQAPAGWEVAGDAEFYTEAYAQTFWLPFAEAGE